MNGLEQIFDRVERYREQPFLIEAETDRVLSFGEFHTLACRFAEGMDECGIGPGDRVGFLLDNSLELAVLYFACWYRGITAVAMHPASPKQEVDFLLEKGRVKMLFTEESLQRWMPQALKGTGEKLKPLDGVDPQMLALITLTSGTTGLPKGIVHRLGGLLGAAALFNRQMPFDQGNRFLHLLPMSYMAGVLNTLLCPFLAGASVVLAPSMRPERLLRFWESVLRYEVDTLWLTPAILEALLVVDRSDIGRNHGCRRVRNVCVGTAPLSLKTRKAFEERYGLTLFESYGLSELLFVSMQSRAFQGTDGSVGRALPGVQIKVVDGELLVRTPFVMAGYLNWETGRIDPVAQEGWFATGDLGHLDVDGNLFVTGRKKEIIIRGGINISPRAVEEVLLEHRAVRQAAVVGLPHDLYGEEVVAVVGLRPGHSWEALKDSLQTFCRSRLPEHAVPTRFEEMAQFPMTAGGKVQKQELKGRLLGHAAY